MLATAMQCSGSHIHQFTMWLRCWWEHA